LLFNLLTVDYDFVGFNFSPYLFLLHIVIFCSLCCDYYVALPWYSVEFEWVTMVTMASCCRRDGRTSKHDAPIPVRLGWKNGQHVRRNLEHCITYQSYSHSSYNCLMRPRQL